MDLERIKLSYGKCVMQDGFLDRFYEVFLASNPEFPKLFENTDFKNQKSLLRNTINFLLMYSSGSNVAAKELDRVAVIHDQNHVNIKPEYYRYWLDSLIKVFKEFDTDFDQELEKDWREIANKGIQIFKDKYLVR